MFPQELARASRLLEAQLELGLGELVARGLVTCDSFAGLRALIVPASRRRHRMAVAGRWSLLPRDTPDPGAIEMVARQLLKRTGVVFRRTLLREKQPFSWRELLRVLRTLEARGEVRGGRFVSGFEGEQYALPEAVSLLRSIRRRERAAAVHVSAGDPLNFRGILTPDERVSPMARQRVLVA
jgi:ATP-dependent Lhr-like helicase